MVSQRAAILANLDRFHLHPEKHGSNISAQNSVILSEARVDGLAMIDDWRVVEGSREFNPVPCRNREFSRCVFVRTYETRSS
jgi:hypothetical protein